MKQPALGIKIAEGRIKNSMTQKELADLCNIDIRTIQRIEAGEVVPRMYTLKLLSTALGLLPDYLSGEPENIKRFNSKTRTAFIAGIIFSISSLPAVFYLLTRSLSPVVHILSMIVFIVSCIIFFRGFFFLSRQYNNPVLMISSFLTMILLPLINIIELLRIYIVKTFRFTGIGIAPTLFTLLCINAIVFGIGLLIEARKRKTPGKINLYQITGIVTIIQTFLFLSSNFTLAGAGLIISIITDLLLSIILYREYKGPEKGYIKTPPGSSLAW
jgi:transcriptional regulator with XRE-family HTH domain